MAPQGPSLTELLERAVPTQRKTIQVSCRVCTNHIPMPQNAYSLMGKRSGVITTRLVVKIVCQTTFATEGDGGSTHICMPCKRKLDQILKNISGAHDDIMILRKLFHGFVTSPDATTRKPGQCLSTFVESFT
jgi:hypothetical protein